MRDEVTEIEERVLNAIDIDGMLKYLCEIIAVPSYGGNETAAQKNIAAKMREIGFEVETWEIDFHELSKHPKFSMSIDREEGLDVVGTIGEKRGGRDLILNGHIDTVAPGDEDNWSYPPLEGTITDGRVYGRGACDMKGGLCCAIYAAKAILDAGVQLKGELMIESVIGEEDGGAGALAAVLRGYTADGAVVMEPSETKIAPVHAGALSFRVTVPGKSAHACVREEGVSAIEKFMLIHEALRVLEDERNRNVDDPLYSRYKIPYALNIGTVHGGNWPGSVAESLAFEGRIGVAVGEKVEEARQRFEETIKKVALADPWLRDHPPTVEWRGYQFDPGRIPLEEPIVKTVTEAYADATGKVAQLEGMTYASDMRHLINTGETPTLIFGPGDVRNAHSPNEYVLVEELVAVARSLALTILRFCGYETHKKS